MKISQIRSRNKKAHKKNRNRKQYIHMYQKIHTITEVTVLSLSFNY
jgi:hypothetical protein